MKKTVILAAAFVVVFAAAREIPAQSTNGVDIWVPSFDARVSMGFNYDLLRPLTNVSFDYPLGYVGFNVPLGGNVLGFLDDAMLDEIFSNSDMFRRGQNFRPMANAAQHSNYTIRVDVPMVSGVGSFSYIQNFFFNFNTALGGSDVLNVHKPVAEIMADDADPMGGFVSLRGALRLPLSINMGWETMTFGYAYRPMDNLTVALNFHRHLFSMDARLRADIDILGHANVIGTFDGMDLSFNEEIINYNSDICNGSAQGRYRVEAWTPSFAVKWDKFSLNSRFGMNVKAKGSASGGFVVPRIINLETGNIDIDLDNISDPTEILGLITDVVDTVFYEVGGMSWTMPQGHTLAYEIIRNRFSVSYTKLFGDINMKINDIRLTHSSVIPVEENSWLNDTLRNVNVGVKIDHILVFQLHHPSFFANVGICGIEAWSTGRDGERNYALGESGRLESLRIGDVGGVVMVLPVVSGGVNLGTRLQLRLEADILPLPAFRTGVNYFF